MTTDTKALRELLDKATKRPWEYGYWMGQCRIEAHRGHHPGPPACKYEPMWCEPYDHHQISSKAQPDATVAGNYECEAGGIVKKEDADLILAAVNSLPDLLDQVERLREALNAIAAPDALLDANDAVFAVHAARRMQEQARAALKEKP